MNFNAAALRGRPPGRAAVAVALSLALTCAAQTCTDRSGAACASGPNCFHSNNTRCDGAAGGRVCTDASGAPCSTGQDCIDEKLYLCGCNAAASQSSCNTRENTTATLLCLQPDPSTCANTQNATTNFTSYCDLTVASQALMNGALAQDLGVLSYQVSVLDADNLVARCRYTAPCEENVCGLTFHYPATAANTARVEECSTDPASCSNLNGVQNMRPLKNQQEEESSGDVLVVILIVLAVAVLLVFICLWKYRKETAKKRKKEKDREQWSAEQRTALNELDQTELDAGGATDQFSRHDPYGGLQPEDALQRNYMDAQQQQQQYQSPPLYPDAYEEAMQNPDTTANRWLASRYGADAGQAGGSVVSGSHGSPRSGISHAGSRGYANRGPGGPRQFIGDNVAGDSVDTMIYGDTYGPKRMGPASDLGGSLSSHRNPGSPGLPRGWGSPRSPPRRGKLGRGGPGP